MTIDLAITLLIIVIIGIILTILVKLFYNDSEEEIREKRQIIARFWEEPWIDKPEELENGIATKVFQEPMKAHHKNMITNGEKLSDMKEELNHKHSYFYKNIASLDDNEKDINNDLKEKEEINAKPHINSKKIDEKTDKNYKITKSSQKKPEIAKEKFDLISKNIESQKENKKTAKESQKNQEDNKEEKNKDLVNKSKKNKNKLINNLKNTFFKRNHSNESLYDKDISIIENENGFSISKNENSDFENHNNKNSEINSKKDTNENISKRINSKQKIERKSKIIIIRGKTYELKIKNDIIFNYNNESYSSQVLDIKHDNVKIKYRSKEKWIDIKDIKKIF